LNALSKVKKQNSGLCKLYIVMKSKNWKTNHGKLRISVFEVGI
jgi:hypothetical protein